MVTYPKARLLVAFGFLLFLAGLALAGCSQEPQTVEVTREVVKEVQVTVEVPGPEVEVTRIVEVMVEPEVAEIPFEDLWLTSGHADKTAEAFVHWNEDDPAEVPTSCAKCHSTSGYLDFLGADGSAAGVVDAPAPIGSTVECAACHNDVTIVKDSVVFPSGIEITGLGDESRCMECHQGRSSKLTVDQRIVDAGLAEAPDDASEDLGFTNIHYYAAAATQYGTLAKGGYEYDGKTYDGRFAHVEGYDTCISCHNPHTLEVRFDECTACHTGLDGPEDLLDIRMAGSLVDYDGDGDMEEGIYDEIEGMREILYGAMQSYAANVAGAPIIYDAGSYPYFFTDADGNNAMSEGDGRYGTWTPRLTKAAYNYQVSLKDPGRFAHGGKYIIQLLYDSIEDLNGALAEPVDMSMLRRIDHGHFAGSEEAFRHWDEDGFVVPGSCSKCHTADGLPQFISEGVTTSQPAANGFKCSTCHTSVSEFTIYEVASVAFPSGANLSFDEGDLPSNLCIQCHQGRESTASVNARIGSLGDNEISDRLSFRNIHYFPAGVTVFGGEAAGAYQFADQEYLGRNTHVGAFNSCNECHNTHALEVEYVECADCHENVQTMEDLKAIRVIDDDNPAVDYDGDGDVAEGLHGEIETMRTALYAALQAYTAGTEGVAPILYSPSAYPYFFADTNGNGEVDGEDGRYATWTPALLRSAYNYQYATKDPGGYAHNGKYVIQVLYDSIAAIGGDVSGMTRP